MGLKYLGFCHNITGLTAAAAKSLQSCPTLCDPIDGSPPGSPVPGTGLTKQVKIAYCLLSLIPFSRVKTVIWASLVAQLVKNPPAMRETWVQSLNWEDPLEKGKATHFSILA